MEPTDALLKELVKHVRKEIGPIATPDVIQWAPGLPKTRSGKIMRRILRKIAENETGPGRRHQHAGRSLRGRGPDCQPAPAVAAAGVAVRRSPATHCPASNRSAGVRLARGVWHDCVERLLVRNDSSGARRSRVPSRRLALFRGTATSIRRERHAPELMPRAFRRAGLSAVPAQPLWWAVTGLSIWSACVAAHAPVAYPCMDSENRGFPCLKPPPRLPTPCTGPDPLLLSAFDRRGGRVAQGGIGRARPGAQLDLRRLHGCDLPREPEGQGDPGHSLFPDLIRYRIRRIWSWPSFPPRLWSVCCCRRPSWARGTCW